MTHDIRRLAEIATGQRGVGTRGQVAGELTDDELRHRIQSGVLEPICSTRSGARSPSGRCWPT